MQSPILKVIFCLVMVTLTLYHASNSENIDIVRGESDRFTNIVGCNDTNAVCFGESCAYCECMVNQTFVRTRGQFGKCVSNELIVYATSSEAYFLLQNYLHKFCLYQKPVSKYTFVLGSTKCSYENWNSRWIWTNCGQLLNWQTLECMTDDYHVFSKKQHFITVKKCDRNNQKQLWKCMGDKKHMIKQKQSGRYMYYGEYSKYVTIRKTHWSLAQKWARFGSYKDVCSEAVGCETFADGSSLVSLKTKCEESKCLGEKMINLRKTKCFLLPNTTQYLHNDTWKALQIKNGCFFISSSDNKVFLKWNLNKTPKSWKGLIVKVQFQCENSTAKEITTEHCVVIKYTGIFTGFNHKEEDIKPSTDIPTEDLDHHNKESNSAGGKDKTRMIIIIVCTLVLLCIAGVIGIIVYKRRNRSVCSKQRRAKNQDKHSSPVVELVLAESAKPSGGNSKPITEQLQLYAIPKQEHEYQRVFANDRTFGTKPGSPKYELPQSPKYEYPEQFQGHLYEYPSLGKPKSKNDKSKNRKRKENEKADTTGKAGTSVLDGGYTVLVRSALNNNQSDDSGYAPLNNFPRGKVEETEWENEPDRSLNTMDGEYTQLVRPSLKNNESEPPRYAPLINGQKRSEEADYAEVA